MWASQLSVCVTPCTAESCYRQTASHRNRQRMETCGWFTVEPNRGLWKGVPFAPFA